MTLPDRVLRRRFDAKWIPEPNSGCWLWEAGHNEHGYGVFWTGRRLEKAHRVAFRLYRGVVLEAEVVCHKCDTPACVNPRHLFVAGMRENTQDMLAKKRHRTVAFHGETNGARQLSRADVDVIQMMLHRGVSQRTIAAQFGVHQGTISLINTGKTWSSGDERSCVRPD